MNAHVSPVQLLAAITAFLYRHTLLTIYVIQHRREYTPCQCVGLGLFALVDVIAEAEYRCMFPRDDTDSDGPGCEQVKALQETRRVKGVVQHFPTYHAIFHRLLHGFYTVHMSDLSVLDLI